MERIKRLFPIMPQFIAPERLLLLDGWADAAEAQTYGESTISRMGETLCALRDHVEHHRLVCTEEHLYTLPQTLLEHDFGGVVILPPLIGGRGPGDVLSALLVRQQTVRQQTVEQRSSPGKATSEISPPEVLTQFWSNIPRTLITQRDLGAFLISLVLSALPKNIAVTIISLNTLLSGGATGRLREHINHEASLRFVIEFGENWFGFQQQMQMAAICLDTGSSTDQIVRLFKIPSSRTLTLDDVVKDFQRLCRQQGGATQYGYVMRSGLPENSSWLVEAHHPRWEAYLNELRVLGELTHLPNLGRLTRPLMQPGQQSEEPTHWPALHPRQITADGTIDFDTSDNPRYWVNEPTDLNLRFLPGDVILRQIHAFTGQASPLRLAVFPKTDETWYLGSNQLRFRFNDDVDPSLREYVVAYLRSSEAAQWMSARSPGITLTPRLLEELPVPIPDESVLEAFTRLRETRDQFTAWARQLQDVEERLFSFSTLKEARQELLVVSAHAQQRIMAAQATETLSWRIRNLYPHPLAFRWRTIEILESSVEKYLEILRAAEVCVAYIAIVGCALAEFLGTEYTITSAVNIAKGLRERPGTGVTFWSWVSILQELNTGSKFRNLDPTTPFIEVTKLYETYNDLSSVIRSLMQKRNDMAHDRGPSGFDLATSITAAESELETLYESVEFLSRYPLRDIAYTRRLGRRQQGTYTCRDLVGDHPVPAIRNVDFTGIPPAQGLHLIDQRQQPHYIEPWLVRRRCETCHHEETYILDRYMRDGQIMFKSLEYGHESNASDLREALQDVGLILPSI